MTKACPFCGSNKTRILNTNTKFAKWVECITCKSNGPIAGDDETAILKWNDRFGVIETKKSKSSIWNIIGNKIFSLD